MREMSLALLLLLPCCRPQISFEEVPNPPIRAASTGLSTLDAEIRAVRETITLIKQQREILLRKRAFLFPGVASEVKKMLFDPLPLRDMVVVTLRVGAR